MTKSTKKSNAKKPASKKSSAKSKSASKKVATKKSTKVAKNGNGKAKKAKVNPLHDKLVSLFTRPSGATLTDTWNAGYKYPAMQALKIAERRGLKTSSSKADGEMTRYFAKR